MNTSELLREILNSGSCCECRHKDICKFRPEPGTLARYNCPFFIREGEKK